jgi:hypothetical protein
MTFQPGDRLVSRKTDWETLGTIHVESPDGGPPTFTIIRITEPQFTHQVSEPNPADVIVRPRRGTADYDAYRRVGGAAAELLFGGRDIELNELITAVSQKLPAVPNQTISDYVRCHVASGGLLAHVRGTNRRKTILSLSEFGILGLAQLRKAAGSSI